MSSRLLVVVLAVIGVAAHTVPAGATVLATDEQRLAWFLPVARAQFPNSPCDGREQIILHANLSGYDDGTDKGYVVDPSTCQVLLADGMDNYRFCAILTHELGAHLAGLGHSTDPESILNHNVPMDYAPCLDAQPRASVAEALGIVIPTVLHNIVSTRWIDNATVAVITTRVRHGRHSRLSHWRCFYSPTAICSTGNWQIATAYSAPS